MDSRPPARTISKLHKGLRRTPGPTGLPRRRTFKHRPARWLSRAGGHGSPSAFLQWHDPEVPARKWSVSIDENLAERVEEHVGGRGLSGFVAQAVEHELERDALSRYLRPRRRVRGRAGRSSRRLRPDVALMLDTEALSVLARPRSNPERHQRVRAVLRSAERRRELVRVPSATLIELYRGKGTTRPSTSNSAGATPG